MFSNNTYAKLWKIEKVKDKNYYQGQISTSRKNQNGEYETDFSASFVRFVGDAAKTAEKLNDGDRIRIINCGVTNSYDKETQRIILLFNGESGKSIDNSLVELLKKNIKDMMKNIETEAIRDYDFFDEKDFIKNYYKPMYEHFGIINNGIEKLLKDANKKTRSNFVLKFLYKNEKMSFGAHILYLFAYFPLFIAYLIFEIFKEVFGKFYKMVIPFTIFYVLFLNIFIPKFTRLNRFYYSVSWIYNRKLWIKHITYLYRGLFELQIKRGFSVFLFSLVIVALYVIIYVGSTVIVYRILRDIGKGLNKEVDWNGIERTFDNIFLTIRKDAAELFNEAKLLYYKKFILKLILNAVCIVLMFRAIQWLSG